LKVVCRDSCHGKYVADLSDISRPVKFCARDVYTQTQPMGWKLLFPALQLKAGLLHHPMTQLVNDTVILGHRNEDIRGNVSQLRMKPAHQRFYPADFAGSYVINRLVDQRKFFALDGLLERVLHQECVDGSLAH
jgi:hypothetical protein